VYGHCAADVCAVAALVEYEGVDSLVMS
jgi:hypothetical protein